MNFGFSGEMIFIFFLALILFGPKKMPEIGRQVARFLGEFRRASNEFRSQIEAEVNSLDTGGPPKQQILPSLQAPLGSLASRILNPPSAQRLEAAEATAAASSSASAANQGAELAAAPPIIVEAESSAAPKAAPDA